MLCINHEFGSNTHVLGKPAPESLEDVRLTQNVLGVSVLRLRKDRNGEWRVVRSKNTRRITVNSPMAFSGPAADSPLLQNPAGNIALGTLNNRAAWRLAGNQNGGPGAYLENRSWSVRQAVFAKSAG